MPQLFILTGVIVIWQSVSWPSLHLIHGIENDLLIPLNFIAGQNKNKRCITGGVRCEAGYAKSRGAGSRHRPTA